MNTLSILSIIIAFLLGFLIAYFFLKKRIEEKYSKFARHSAAVLSGKSLEHLLPLSKEFPFNPRDARFIGDPVDYIIFNGLSEGELENIIFLEVKSNKARLNEREKQIRKIVKEGKIKYGVLRKSYSDPEGNS